MNTHRFTGFGAIMLALVICFSALGMEPSKKKKPVRKPVSRTDPTLSMNKSQSKKLTKIKKMSTKKRN